MNAASATAPAQVHEEPSVNISFSLQGRYFVRIVERLSASLKEKLLENFFHTAKATVLNALRLDLSGLQQLKERTFKKKA